ncbi:tyrosine-type recombinase/integrase [Microbacterium sp. M]|uniref:tyrosine-type recombinase/integrase n=1 Tax=Microbacterium sp. M TaxID=3377125 RepID=UPI003870D3CA
MRYRVRYRTLSNKQTSKRGFTTKKEAKLFASSVDVSKARGEFVDPAKARATVGEVGIEWLKTKEVHLKPSSYRPVEIGWRLRVKPTWGATPLGKVEHEDVQSWIDAMVESGLSATVVLRDYGTLIGILDRAVREKRIPGHRARGVHLPEKKGKPRRYLSHKQVELLALGAGDNATFIYTLAYCGIRWGEAVGLRVQSVDLKRRRLNIEENAVQVARKIIVGSTKNDEARSVPIPKFLAKRLKPIVTSRSPDLLVFGNGLDHSKTPNVYWGWFARAVKAARLADPNFPEITPHDLRHTAASLAISSGANVKALQRMLGHKSAAITLDVYADLFDEDLDRVGDALDQARSGAIVSKVGPKKGKNPRKP